LVADKKVFEIRKLSAFLYQHFQVAGDAVVSVFPWACLYKRIARSLEFSLKPVIDTATPFVDNL
jgi:hypothetical protein